MTIQIVESMMNRNEIITTEKASVTMLTSVIEHEKFTDFLNPAAELLLSMMGDINGANSSLNTNY